MSNVSFNNVQAGDKVNMHDHASASRYDNHNDIDLIFMGFTDLTVKHGEGGVAFKNLREVKKKYNVRTAEQVENLGDDMDYGHNIYAIFKDINTDDPTRLQLGGGEFAAYLFNGKWGVGSGADPVALSRLT